MNPFSDQPFVVGRDLVQFDRRQLPIYETVPADLSCSEPLGHGAPLDRLFGDAEHLHVDGVVPAIALDAGLPAPDALVELGTLSDALALPGADPVTLAAAFEAEVQIALSSAGGATADYPGIDWTFDVQS
jgi:hypothetical protein